MAFWVIVAKIIKVILQVKRILGLLKAASEHKLGEYIVTSIMMYYIGKFVVDSGIPLDKLKVFDLEYQAESWATSVLKDTDPEFAALNLSPLQFLTDKIDTYYDQLMKGQAVANSQDPRGNIMRAADPIILSRGEFERQILDLPLNGAGIDFEFVRTYRSSTGYIGPMGLNWDHNYNQRLRQDNDYVIVRLTGQLSEERFVRHPRFGEDGFNYFVPSDGVHDVILPDGDTFLLKKPEGLTYRYQATDQLGEHRIKRIEDRFENYLDFKYSYDGKLERIFINSTARCLIIEYDAQDRVSKITDHNNRVVLYTYNSLGYLDCVIGPTYPDEEPAKIERYEYTDVGKGYRLSQVLDKHSNILVENSYEKNELSEFFGYVTKQIENRGETTFQYENLPNSDSTILTLDIPALRVMEYRRNGHQVEHIINEVGNELMTREKFVDGCGTKELATYYRYNEDGNVIAKLDPDGILTQYLYGRDHLANSVSWPDIDPVLGDITKESRMSFNNMLSSVIRYNRITPMSQPDDFWKMNLPSVKASFSTKDVITKYQYNEISLPLSKSDPRYTISADPLHTESSHLGDPSYNPSDARYIEHQRHLTKFEYGPGPRYELERKIYPNKTRPFSVDGIPQLTNLIEEFSYNSNGNIVKKIDSDGYEWFNEYYPITSGTSASTYSPGHANEGFLQRQFLPHIDWILADGRPEILEIQKHGNWLIFDKYFQTIGTITDSIHIDVEGVRITLYQSKILNEMIHGNGTVEVLVDGIPLSTWDQAVNPKFVITGLSVGIHTVELRGNSTQFSIGRIQSHVSLEYEVDELGNVKRKTDARGNLVQIDVNVFGSKTKVTKGPATNPLVVTYEYNQAGKMIQEKTEWRNEDGITYPEGAIIKKFQYDKLGFLLLESKGSENGGDVRITRHRYDSEDNLIETINSLGVSTFFTHNEINRKVRTVRAKCTPEQSISTTKFDLRGNILAKINSRDAIYLNGFKIGNMWHSGIDNLGRVRIKTNPLGSMIITDYDKINNPLIVRMFQLKSGKYELLSLVETEYDEHGDVTKVKTAIFDRPIVTLDPVDQPDVEFQNAIASGDVIFSTIEYCLNAHGKVIAERRPDGTITEKKFDGQDRQYEETDSEGRRTFQIFDGSGNTVSDYLFEKMLDPTTNNVTIQTFLELFEFDELDREIASIDSYGNRWESKYDTVGNKTLSIDPLGNKISYKYNAFGQEIQKTEYLTQTGLGNSPVVKSLITKNIYDLGGNVEAIIDSSNRRTEFKYDSLNRLTETHFVISTAQPPEIRSYDTEGNVTRKVDRNGLVKNFQYNLLNQLVRTDVDASSVSPANRLSGTSANFAMYAYDGVGNLLSHENNYCKVAAQRDSRGLPLLEQITIQNLPTAPSTFFIRREFDLLGFQEKLFYPSGREVLYRYDAAGNLQSVKNISSPADYPGRITNADNFELVTYSYAGNRLSHIIMGNGLVLTKDYDGRGYPLGDKIKRPGNTTIWRRQQLIDPAGFTRLENITTRGGTQSRKFFYDSIYRLVHYQDNAPSWLDPVNVAPPPIPLHPSSTTGQSIINSSITLFNIPTGLLTFEYDEMGNRLNTREPITTLLTSSPNELNQYDTINGISWHYDNNGNLREDDDYTFTYDINNNLQEIIKKTTGVKQVTYYRDVFGKVIAEITPTSKIFLGYDGNIPLVEFTDSGRIEHTPDHISENIIHSAKGGEDYWLTKDELGSLRLLTNFIGDLVSIPNYRPYGFNEDGELGFSPFRFGFGNMWYTPSLPFFHAERRTYRPDVGRFLQRDPINHVDDLNLYSYVQNSPVNRKDPTGLQWKISGGKNDMDYFIDLLSKTSGIPLEVVSGEIRKDITALASGGTSKSARSLIESILHYVKTGGTFSIRTVSHAGRRTIISPGGIRIGGILVGEFKRPSGSYSPVIDVDDIKKIEKFFPGYGVAAAFHELREKLSAVLVPGISFEKAHHFGSKMETEVLRDLGILSTTEKRIPEGWHSVDLSSFHTTTIGGISVGIFQGLMELRYTNYYLEIKTQHIEHLSTGHIDQIITGIKKVRPLNLPPETRESLSEMLDVLDKFTSKMKPLPK